MYGFIIEYIDGSCGAADDFSTEEEALNCMNYYILNAKILVKDAHVFKM